MKQTVWKNFLHSIEKNTTKLQYLPIPAFYVANSQGLVVKNLHDLQNKKNHPNLSTYNEYIHYLSYTLGLQNFRHFGIKCRRF
jgi:hypothetical protein